MKVNLLLLVTCCTSIDHIHTMNYSSVSNLKKTLLANYDNSLRPILDQSDTINVTVTFKLESVFNVDNVAQTITIDAVFVVKWNDELLKWNSSEYNGLKTLTIPEEKRWVPNVLVTNAVNKKDVFSGDLHPYQVTANGKARWFPSAFFKITCELDMTTFPFDVQICSFYIRTIDNAGSDLKLYLDSDFSNDRFQENGEWEVTEITGKNYSDGEPPNLTLLLTISRRPAFIVLNVLLPVIILSFLNVAVFAVSVESGEKLTYVLTVLLSLAVFISTVSGMLPTSSKNIPLITIYLAFQLCVSTVSVLITVYIIRVYNRPQGAAIPAAYQVLARLVKGNKTEPSNKSSHTDAVSWQLVAKALDKVCLYIYGCAAVAAVVAIICLSVK